MIKAVIFDIDGVITDGKILINKDGQELKRISLKDIDAIYDIKRNGFLIGAITGENTEICDYFKIRFPWDFFYSEIKDKLGVIKGIEKKMGLSPKEICYIGDGIYDIESLLYVGLSVCPADAIPEVISSSMVCLEKKGGDGCVWELRNLLLRNNIEGNY